jgi:hypothetical protein
MVTLCGCQRKLIVLRYSRVPKANPGLYHIVSFIPKPSHTKGRSKLCTVKDPEASILLCLANRFPINFAFSFGDLVNSHPKERPPYKINLHGHVHWNVQNGDVVNTDASKNRLDKACVTGHRNMLSNTRDKLGGHH